LGDLRAGVVHRILFDFLAAVIDGVGDAVSQHRQHVCDHDDSDQTGREKGEQNP
jgi:hypothetical protein